MTLGAAVTIHFNLLVLSSDVMGVSQAVGQLRRKVLSAVFFRVLSSTLRAPWSIKDVQKARQ